VDISTSYLGLDLKNPIVPSSSPLTCELDSVKKLEDAGAAALVMHSFFEEQIQFEAEALDHFLLHGTDSCAEATSYFPEADDYRLGPEEYLEQIRKIKKTVDIPVIASLNGVSTGGWIDYAKKMQDAGADAIELNVYFLPTDLNKSSADIEQVYVDVAKAVKSSVIIPVALKLSPFFTNVVNISNSLVSAGVDGLVLFNRFYQPDIDIEKLEVEPNLKLSKASEMRLPLRWIAILYGRIQADLAHTTGIYTATDVIKSIMAGANVTMMCSALLKHGENHIADVLKDTAEWMEEHEYESIEQMRGSMSQKNCPEPTAFERANYMKSLQSYT
jgi:dihydroorotate dehydrogenase (fumarate)